jgi:hypothetical protein
VNFDEWVEDTYPDGKEAWMTDAGIMTLLRTVWTAARQIGEDEGFREGYRDGTYDGRYGVGEDEYYK